jgi:chromosome segregation ATPase
MPRKLSPFGPAAFAIALTLAAPDQLLAAAETDPYKISTRDLIWGGKRLDQHLETRREYLAVLNERLMTLDDELLSSQSKLFSVRGELEEVEQPSRELQALLTEIEVLQIQYDTLSEELFDATLRMEEIQASIEQQNVDNEALRAALLEAKGSVEAVEKRMEIVESSIASGLRIRAMQILDESS